MNKSVKKFIDFLSEEHIKIQREFVIESIKSRKYSKSKLEETSMILSEHHNIIRQLSVEPSSYELLGEVFVHFDVLSTYLSKANLSYKDVFNIVITFLKKNLATGICEIEGGAFNPKYIDSYPFKEITPEEVHNLIHQDRYRLLLATPEEKRTPKENAIVKELEAYTSSHPDDVEEYRKIHILIKENYFDKQDSFNSENIDLFIEQLRKLKLSEEHCDMIKLYLTKELTKRNKKEQVYIPKRDIKVPVESLSIKEKNILYRKLCTYYNPDTLKITKYLTIDEVMYCLSLMRKLNFSKESIITFLKVVEKNNKLYSLNPLTIYNDLYKKLTYYEDNPTIKEHLDYISSIINEMFIVSDEDYKEWQMLLEEELSIINSILSGNYEYELRKSLNL